MSGKGRLLILVPDGHGLLEINEQGIYVTPGGQLLIRNICMVFDVYLKQHAGQRFSKVI